MRTGGCCRSNLIYRQILKFLADSRRRQAFTVFSILRPKTRVISAWPYFRKTGLALAPLLRWQTRHPLARAVFVLTGRLDTRGHMNQETNSSSHSPGEGSERLDQLRKAIADG